MAHFIHGRMWHLKVIINVQSEVENPKDYILCIRILKILIFQKTVLLNKVSNEFHNLLTLLLSSLRFYDTNFVLIYSFMAEA